MEKRTIIIGVIGSDCHAVGNTIMNHTLKEKGFNVVNLGVLTPQEDFINAAIETDADAILVSSLYGHGEIDCRGMREKADEAGLGNIIIYVGGNIVVGKRNWDEVENLFLDMGFNRVFKPGTPMNETIDKLIEDLSDFKLKE